MGGQQLLIILSLLIPVPIATLLLLYISRRRAPVDLPLALLVIAGGIWCGFYALELALESYSAKLLAGRIQYFAFVLAPLAWFMLGMELRGWLSRIGLREYTMLLIIPGMTLGLVFTSGSHDFFWRSKELVEFNGLRHFQNTYGPGFWIHLVYSYLLNIAAVILAVSSFLKSDSFYSGQRLTIAIAMVMPWLTNIIYVFRLTDFTIDLTPFAIIISSLILVLGVFRYRFGNLVPVVRERIMAEMHDAVLVLDDSMHVVDFNTALQELFPQKEIIVGLDLAELLHLHSKLLRLLQRQQENSDFMYTGFADRVHRVSTELIMAGQGVPARLIMFRDLSTDSRMEGVLRLIIEDTAEDVGEDFYRSLTRSLALVLSTKYAMVAVTDTKNEGQMNTLAFWNGEDHQQDFSYPLAGAPSEEILRRGSCKYTEGVAGRFPQDKVLADMGVESYLGTSLFSHDGIPVGVLAVMDIGLFKYTELAASVLEIFGIRAATEIERRQNEVRIENSEKSYRQIVETTGDGVCVVDGEGVIEFVNAPMEALLATDREALVGEVFVDQFILEREVGEKVASLEDGTLEFKMINRREDERWVVASKKAIRPSEGVAAGVLYMFSDCTEQHLLAAENKAIEEQLRHAQKLESLGVLAGGVAHDFNNLLMPIVGYVELIRRRASKDEQVAKYLQRIETAGEKLADLCNQMLTYSGKGHFVESVVDVNELVVEMQDLVRASIPNNISLTYFVKDNLPLVKVDTTQISQVIMNLVLNASEATGKNQEGKVKVSTGEAFLDDSSQESLYVADKLVPGNYVYFEVEDQGVGITTEDQERLFEPFYTTKFTGRGLGMAVVFGIVRAHKGAIEVNSEVGYGSRIRVYFPVTPGLVELSDATGDDKPHDSLQGRGRVLVVDDEAYVREILSGMLQDMGLEVIEAADGEAGMQAYLENRIELAACIIDLTMPGMNGNDLAAGIMEKDSDFPIILVSGYSQKDVSSSLLSSPNIMFMQKPITFPQFSSAMSHQLKAVAAGRNVR